VKKSEVAELVIYAQSMQGREATDLQIEAWHTLLAEVPVDVAKGRARAHFAAESRELWPADVLRTRPEEYPEGDEWMGFSR
jgi:hypothetical protein